MIFLHSIKSILRTPKKTILFLFLLMILTILICIGAGMYDSARNMLSEADETFTSMVQLNYMEENLGDDEEFFERMNSELAEVDLTNLSKDKSVKAVGMEKDAWAFLEGETIKQNDSQLKNYAIFKVSSIHDYLQEGMYQGIVDNILFGSKIKENTHVLINTFDEEGNRLYDQMIPGHQYLVIGKKTDGRNPTPIIIPGISGVAEGLPSIVDLDVNPDFFLTEEGKEVLRLQEAMAVVDNSLPVTLVSNLEATEAYFFNDIVLEEGRVFAPSDYEEGSNDVLLISKTIADFYQVKTNDKLKLSLHYSKSGIGLSDYLKSSEFSEEAEYRIIGIFQDNDDIRYNLYMPNAGWIEQEHHFTTPIRYIVQNEVGERFVRNHQGSLPMNMELTLYDQGYAEAVKPIRALQNNAVLILVLGLLLGVAILTLFSYLYVAKQKDTLRTMLTLGTSIRRTVSYILFGSMLLVLSASCLGAYISSLFLTKVTQALFHSLQDNYVTDLRYSERAIGLNTNYIPELRSGQWLPALGIMTVFLISLVILLFFTLSTLRENAKMAIPRRKRQKKTHLPKKNRSSRMRFGKLRPISLKFALISTTRSPGRSLIIPVISLLLSVFIIFLGLLSSKQQEELTTVYDRIPVAAYLTNYRNATRDLSGLDLEYDIYKLVDPEYILMMDSKDGLYSSGSSIQYNIIINPEDYEGVDFSDPEFINQFNFADQNATVNIILRDNSDSVKLKRQKLLSESKYFQDMMLYSSIHYEYMGIARTKDWVTNEDLSQLPEIREHKNAFGYDWFIEKIKKMPRLAYADDLRYTPDFFNASEPKVEFLPGYSYDSLKINGDLGIISRNFANTNGIELGDVARVTGWYTIGDDAMCSVIDFTVVGIYEEEWRPDTIYISWIRGFNQTFYKDAVYTSEGSVGYGMGIEERPRKLRSATFILKNTQNLSDFRDYIENLGYSRIGKMRANRRAIVIQDKNLVDTIQNLKNHIRIIETIKPVMLVLFGIIGFAVSYLLMKHRVNELAIMRSMGARKRQVFLSYFIEQGALFFVGLIPAAVYAVSLPGQVLLYGASLLYFILSYLMGTAIALIFMNRAKIMDILFTKE